MIEKRTQLTGFFNAANNSRITFIKRDVDQLEDVIEQLIDASFKLTAKTPIFGLCIVNSTCKELDFVSRLLSQQALTTLLVCSKLGFQSGAAKSLCRASLYFLYSLLPSIIKIKTHPTTKNVYLAALKTVSLDSFSLARKLKIKDQNCLKILSQICRKNRYFNTNQLNQTAVIFSINSNLISHLGLFSPKVTINHAMASQFGKISNSNVANPYLINQLSEFYHLPQRELLLGSVVTDKQKQLQLIIGQSDDCESWLCLNISAQSNELNSEIHVINNEDIVFSQPQRPIHLTSLADIFNSHKSLLPDEVNCFVNQNKHEETVLRYGAPDDWQETNRLFMTGGVKKISQQIGYSSYQSNLILNHATTRNRKAIKITKTKHAVAMLGLNRVYPVIVDGSLQNIQHYYIYSGSEELNNKVNAFCLISSLITRRYTNEIDEYTSVLARLLFLSLVTIPKFRFSVTNSNNTTSKGSSTAQSLTLASLYGNAQLDNWSKICLMLCHSWQLPAIYKQSIQYYFSFNQKIRPSEKTSPINKKHCAILNLTTLMFAKLTGSYNDTIENQMIEDKIFTNMNIKNEDRLELKNYLIENVELYSSLK